MEDTRVNRLEESRNIFDTIVNHRTFADVSMILFLNKQDLLEDKVTRKKIDISTYFEEFQDTEEIKKYVSDKFSGNPMDLTDVRNFILYLFSYFLLNIPKISYFLQLFLKIIYLVP